MWLLLEVGSMQIGEFKKPRVPMLIFNKINLKQIVKPLPEMITILSSYMSVQQDKTITSVWIKLQNAWTKMAKLKEKQTVPQS